MQGNRSQERSLAPTHEVNNLQPVTVLQRCFWPLSARHNVAIEFHGHAVALHSQLLDELDQCERISEGPFFAVDRQLHKDSFEVRVASCKL